MSLRNADKISAAVLLAFLVATPAFANPDVEAARGETYALLALPLLLFAIIAIEVLVFRLTLRPPRLWRTVAAANTLSAVIATVTMIVAPSRDAQVMAYGVGYLMEVGVLVVAWQALGAARVLAVAITANVLSTLAFFFVLLPGWTVLEDFISRPRVALTKAAHWAPAGLNYLGGPNAPRLLGLHLEAPTFDAVDAGRVWLRPGEGNLLRSTDGGRHWQRLPETVDGVDFVTRDVGWAARRGPRYGSPASLGRTTDGGQTWRWQEVGDPGIAALFAVDGEEAWAATESAELPRLGMARLLHTGNGGHTWQSVPIPPAHSIRAMTFLDHRLGWLVADSPRTFEDRAPFAVLRTSDGGGTFQTALTPKLAAWGGSCTIDFVSPREGWITAGAPRLLHTRDGGATWEAVTPSTPEGVAPSHLLDCWFLNPKVGWAVGCLDLRNESHALALGTRDGGRTWTRLDTGAEKMTNAYFDRVLFLDETHGWLCGGSFDKPTGDWPWPSRLTQFVLRYRP